MLDVTTVFTKVFVREFYRLNAGFFIVIITLTFGFMSGREHQALAEFFVASPLLALIPVTVWTIYSIKVMLFNHQRMTLAENLFVFNTSLLPHTRQLRAATQAVFLQNMPLVLYGAFLLATAIRNNFYQSFVLLLAAIVALLFVSAVALVRNLKTPVREFSTSALKKFIDKHTVRPLWWIYIVTVLRQEPFLFVGTKVFTSLLLFAIMQLYVGEMYDSRLLAMAAAFAGIGNYMVMMQLQLFDFRYFLLMKGLPITLLRRWLYLATVTLIFVLPEMVMITKYAPALPIAEIIFVMMLIPSLALLVYSLLYIKFQDEESYGRLTFAIAIAHVILILFKVPVVVFLVVSLITAAIIFAQKYYKFELPPPATK